MNPTKPIAIAAVLIIVISAAAIVVVNSSSSDDEVEIGACLRVFGNANEDYKIDEDDVKTMELYLKMTEEDRAEKFAANPLLDANYDGDFNEKDLELVKKIVRDEPCTVWHYNESNNQNYVVSTKWPVKSALATAAANNLWLITAAGISDKIHGITYSLSSPPDPSLFPQFSKMESIGGSSTTMPVDNASKWISEYGVTAIISDKSESTISKKDVEPVYEDMGVDIIRVGAAIVDIDNYCAQLFLLGFLFQTEDKCVDIAKWWGSLQKEIEDKLEGVEKVKVVACNGNAGKNGIWVSAGNSDYKALVVAAGGEYALGDEVLTDYAGGAYFKKTDGWLYNYDVDKIINIRTNDWYSGTVDNAAKYEDSVGIFSETEAYQNGQAYVITGDAPIPIRLAYAAAVMYPDIFPMEWADQKNQEYLELFTESTLDISDLHFYISYEMATGAN